MSTHDKSVADLMNNLVDETAVDTDQGDLVLTAAQWEACEDQHFLRRLAGRVESDGVTGRSTMLEIRAALVCQKSLAEYSDEE